MSGFTCGGLVAFMTIFLIVGAYLVGSDVAEGKIVRQCEETGRFLHQKPSGSYDEYLCGKRAR